MPSLFGKKDEKKSDDDFDPKDLLKSMNAMGEAFTTMQGEMPKQIAAAVAQAVKAAMPKPTIEPEPEPEPNLVGAEDLEKMSRSDFMAHITETIVTAIKKDVSDPLNKDIEDAKTSTERERLVREINTAKSDHSDFMNWGPEVRDLVQRNPNLSIEQAYQLARSQDGEKSITIDKELEEGLKKKAEEDAKAKELADRSEEMKEPAVMSLFPTSAPSSTGEDRDPVKSNKEAADRAWEDVGMDRFKPMMEG